VSEKVDEKSQKLNEKKRKLNSKIEQRNQIENEGNIAAYSLQNQTN
jgi:phosphoglycerate-specific signal transduction histidine kinase